jgi:hypothetical protein
MPPRSRVRRKATRTWALTWGRTTGTPGEFPSRAQPSGTLMQRLGKGRRRELCPTIPLDDLHSSRKAVLCSLSCSSLPETRTTGHRGCRKMHASPANGHPFVFGCDKLGPALDPCLWAPVTILPVSTASAPALAILASLCFWRPGSVVASLMRATPCVSPTRCVAATTSAGRENCPGKEIQSWRRSPCA